jgi:lysyl-tRNA synthetase class 2
MLPLLMDDESHRLLAVRREKLAALCERGISPFGGNFAPDGSIGEIASRFAEGAVFRAAGRVTAHRDMGKSHFLDLSDLSGRIQIYVNLKSLTPEQAEVFGLIDLGDFLGIEGEGFITRTCEPTLRVQRFELLTKALRPLPDKYHGLVDVEARHRQRYLDLLANERSREVFRMRSRVLHGIRTFLHERGFLEVETPMMQPVPGGAAAEPFKTHHHALDMDLYLRIAPELYLKRLLVGGFTKVFELNRNFRNEGISRRHNPEFTMLEAYWAYSDFEQMAELMEELICQLAGAGQIEHRDAEGQVTRTIDLKRPWRRARYRDLLREIDPGWFDYTAEGRFARAQALGVEVHAGMADFEVTQQVFEKRIEEKTFDPLFVTHLPKELVPLARQNADDDSLVDVFELIINGMEFAPGYTELTDPIVQRERLLQQAGEETQYVDEEFLLALEHGMPPAGGIGLGIDRLMMLLTGSESIRDVILFPHLRSKE